MLDRLVQRAQALLLHRDGAEVVVGPAHARILGQRGQQLGAGPAVDAEIAVRAADEDVRLGDRTLLDDAREERGGGVGVAQGQRLAGQREGQLQVAGLHLRRGLQLARRAAKGLAGVGLPALRRGQPTRQQPAFE
jgi:hypothetical protein